jgi:hypothetical protein
MDVRISILVITLGIASLAIAPSLIINQSAYSQVESAKHWCESQGRISSGFLLASQAGIIMIIAKHMTHHMYPVMQDIKLVGIMAAVKNKI